MFTSPFKLLHDKHKVNDQLEFQLLTASYTLTRFLKSSSLRPLLHLCVVLGYTGIPQFATGHSQLGVQAEGAVRLSPTEHYAEQPAAGDDGRRSLASSLLSTP